MLLGERDIEETILRPEGMQFDLLPANGDLTAAEVSLLQQDEREFALKRALEPLLAQYAWIFIDCPPSLNMLTLNALAAADSVLIPMQCEYYALEGLSGLLNTVEQVRASVNPGWKSRDCCEPCTMVATTWQRPFRTSSSKILGTGSTERLFRATFAWPKRPATDCRCCCMTLGPKAQWPMWRWPVKCCADTTREETA